MMLLFIVKMLYAPSVKSVKLMVSIYPKFIEEPHFECVR
jgi:hypothetical protein